jgi:hypothetical protein
MLAQRALAASAGSAARLAVPRLPSVRRSVRVAASARPGEQVGDAAVSGRGALPQAATGRAGRPAAAPGGRRGPAAWRARPEEAGAAARGWTGMISSSMIPSHSLIPP